MSPLDPALSRMIEPLRELAIGAILDALAHELEADADVDPEPELRDAAGVVVRSGPLNLPRRGDLAVTRDGRTLVRRIESGPPPVGKSLVAQHSDGFEAEILPFRWDAAEMTVFAKQEQPNWEPLRRWYLEWFQSRYSEVAPDLYGAVHSLDGPRRVAGSWAFTVDFGSAPAACVIDLISAMAKSGAERMRINYA
ncbi:MAG TPA: hypothetical protein VMY41_18235 [Thermohalobaculum sp.]|nr:hypothetical protein [Thermohalobaculum sp.]